MKVYQWIWPGLALGALLSASAAIAGTGWETDFARATALAKEEGKYILLDFTGSDWCPPCILLDRDVFQKEAFQEYALDKLVLVTLDFPRRRKLDDNVVEQNRMLARKYEIRGYPTVVILDPQGEEVGRHVGYRPGGVQSYLEFLDSVIHPGP